MNKSINFFDETARVGSQILEALGGAPVTTAIKTYLKSVAEIYELLADIHDEVADVAVKVSLAASSSEARERLKRIEYQSLEDTFRARHWCDELERLGHALRPLGQSVGLSENDQQIWDEFCEALEQREGEVSMLYDRELYDFRMLAYTDLSLELLKQKVEDIADQLATQKAQFDLLAERAEAMRKQLE